MRAYLTALLALCVAACSTEEPGPNVAVDVPALIGATENDVLAALGKSTCSEDSGGQSCEFDAAYTSVFFFAGEVANITLPHVSDLRTYGLDLGDPEGMTGNREEWETTIGDKTAKVYRFPNYVYVMTHET